MTPQSSSSPFASAVYVERLWTVRAGDGTKISGFKGIGDNGERGVPVSDEKGLGASITISKPRSCDASYD
jgi:hypothetical protein